MLTQRPTSTGAQILASPDATIVRKVLSGLTCLLALSCSSPKPSAPPSDRPDGGGPSASGDDAGAPPSPAPAAPALDLDAVRELLRAGQPREAVAMLEASRPAESSKDRAVATFLLGRERIREGRSREGVALLKALHVAQPVEARRLLWLTRGARAAGDRDDAMGWATALLTLDPVVPEASEIRLAWATMARDRGDGEGSARALSQVAADKASSRQQIGEARLKLCETAAGTAQRQCWIDLMVDLPEVDGASPEAMEGRGIHLDDLSHLQRFTRARQLMRRWRYGEARREFRHLISVRRHVLESRWNVGIIDLRKLRDDPVDARRHFEAVFTRGGRHKEEALLNVAQTYMRQENYEAALEVADRYDELYPRGKYRETMAYYRGWLPYDHGQFRAAIPMLWKYIKHYKARRSLALGFYAWCFVRLKDWRRAEFAMSQLRAYDNPLVAGKGMYWGAFALDKRGRRDDAIARLAELHRTYPLTYYDMLGRQLEASWLGDDPRASALPWPDGGGDAAVRHPLEAISWTWPRLTGELADTFGAVRELVEVDELDAARRLYAPIRTRVERAVPQTRRLDFIRFMGDRTEDYKHGWSLVSRGKLNAFRGMPETSDVRWTMAYPEAYPALVGRLAREADLPAAFVTSIMRQESRYSPAAVSHADAVGALQMIPPTAQRVAAELHIAYRADTFARPEVGFRFSTFYLAKHRDLWHGQLLLTAASYNGGPRPIARWMRENQGATLAFLVEEFAYNESRNYARKVSEHLLRYLYLYESDPSVRGRWLDALFPVAVNYDIPDDLGY